MIYISSSLFLSGDPTLALNTPVFGWQNLLTPLNVSATSEEAGYPASNLANPATYLTWRAEDGSPPGDQYLTFDVQAADPIDYVGIAAHNLGSAQIPFSLEYLDDSVSPPSWTELMPEQLAADDTPILLRFTPTGIATLRLRLQPGTAPARIAVVHVGKLLVGERNTGIDHIPINLARQTQVVTGRSENGNFLGRIITRETFGSSFAIAHMTQAWYRTYFDPFLKIARAQPFFFAWRPQDYPGDVGYCWLTNDPQPTVAFDTDRMSIDLQLGAVSL